MHKHPTRSSEGGAQTVKVPPLPFWTVMFDDLLRTEIFGSMRRSELYKKRKRQQTSTTLVNLFDLSLIHKT